jgi:hypothetical protein
VEEHPCGATEQSSPRQGFFFIVTQLSSPSCIKVTGINVTGIREETMVDEAERERIRRLTNEELAEELGQETEEVNLDNPVYSERYIELLNEFDRRFDSGEIAEPEVPEDFIPRMRDIIRQLPPPSPTRGQPDTTTTEHTDEGCKWQNTDRGREGQ